MNADTPDINTLLDAIKAAGANKDSDYAMSTLYNITRKLQMCEPEAALILINIKRKRIEHTKSQTIKTRLTNQINKIVQYYADNFKVDLLTFPFEVPPIV